MITDTAFLPLLLHDLGVKASVFIEPRATEVLRTVMHIIVCPSTFNMVNLTVNFLMNLWQYKLRVCNNDNNDVCQFCK